MTRGVVAAIIVGVLLASWDWIGVAHNDEVAARRAKLGHAERAAMLENQRAICAKLGVKFIEPSPVPVG